MNHADGEVFSPPYLFDANGDPAVRPVIGAGPNLMRNGGTYTFAASQGVAAWSIVKMAGTTHTMNTDARFLPLAFVSDAPGEYTFSLHENENVLTPGYWMLFAIDGEGVPSVSVPVQVVTDGIPRAAAPDDQFGRVNDVVSLTIDARDPDGDTLDYAANGLPRGLAIDQNTGEISGALEEAGVFNVQVLVDDGTDVAVLAFRWFVTARSNNSEFGRVSVEQLAAGQWFPVELQHLYFDPVVIVGPPTIAGADPAVVRVRDVTANGFEFQIDEWDYRDGAHASETVSWMVLEAGAYVLPNDATLVAGHTDGVDAGFVGQAFAADTFDEAPIVLAQVSTADGVEAVTPRLRNIATTGFDVRLQEQESGDDIVSADRVDWVAIEPGVIDGSLEAARTAGVDSANTVLDFSTAFIDPPDFLASIQTNADPEPAAIRLRATTAVNATLFLEEEQSADPEIAHGDEVVGWMAIGAEVEELPLLRLDNDAPTVADPGQQVTVVDDAGSLLIDANDPDGDPITFEAAGLPTGLGIDEDTGEITGTATAPGEYAVTVTVTDSFGASGQTAFTWIVSERLQLLPFATPPRVVGALVAFTAVTSFEGSFEFTWDFSDGDGAVTQVSTTSHAFAAPGRYVVTVDVVDTLTGIEESIQVVQMIHPAVAGSAPSGSSVTAYETGADRVWVANPDNDTVTVIDATTFAKVAEIAVGSSPRSVAIAGSVVWVTNKRGASISVIDASTLAVTGTVALPAGTRPHGLVFDHTGTSAYVSLEATGSIARLAIASGALTGAADVGPNPRGVALSTDGATLYVSRFITPPQPGEATTNPQTQVGGTPVGGELVPVDVGTMTAGAAIVLRHSDAETTEHSGPGVPNYLAAPVLSPSGGTAWIPSKQDNILAGQARSGSLLDFDSTVRAVTSLVDLAGAGAEIPGARVDHDDASHGSAGVMDRVGAYFYVAFEGNREIGVMDALSGVELGRFPSGRAPQGLTLSPDGRVLFVHNFMDRTVTVHDVSDVVDFGGIDVPRLAEVSLVAAEALAPAVLAGKQFFYDAADPRLSSNGYMACATCHNDGGQDGRVWDFTQFGEGLRNTIGLDGHGVGHGPLHWTANFDELHDFEGQIRGLTLGDGLMDDADFFAGTRSQPLGDPKAGVSADLDALAAYFASLTSVGGSPLRTAGGGLDPTAVQGRDVFAAAGCAGCHGGVAFTDSETSAKHDVGTLTAASGAAGGLDTPTLRGTWATAPYLHDGSAASVEDAIAAHDGVALAPADLAALAAYVRSIDDGEHAANASCDGGECACNSGFFGDPASCAACTPVADCAAVTCNDAGDSTCTGCDPGFDLENGACVEAPDECAVDSDCDDTDACTVGHRCDGGACVAGDQVACDSVALVTCRNGQSGRFVACAVYSDANILQRYINSQVAATQVDAPGAGAQQFFHTDLDTGCPGCTTGGVPDAQMMLSLDDAAGPAPSRIVARELCQNEMGLGYAARENSLHGTAAFLTWTAAQPVPAGQQLGLGQAYSGRPLVFEWQAEAATDSSHCGAGNTQPGIDPGDPDSDDDGLTDPVEQQLGTDPFDADSDDDGVNDGAEVGAGTDPLDADSDDDGLDDGAEVNGGTDPSDADSDDDGLDDGAEAAAGTDPNDPDSDDDGLTDGEEAGFGSDPLDGDSDDDGLGDAAERAAGTNPNSGDSDGDGLGDAAEIAGGTDPNDADSDDDGLTDPEELAFGSDPSDADSDDDGLGDAAERDAGTNPNSADTDADGFTDGDEAAQGTDPTDPSDFPCDCDDGDPCTDDSCGAPGECINAFNTAPCDDGDACTVDDVCGGGACGGDFDEDACNNADLATTLVTCRNDTTGAPVACAIYTEANILQQYQHGQTVSEQPDVPGPGPHEFVFTDLDPGCPGCTTIGDPAAQMTVRMDTTIGILPMRIWARELCADELPFDQAARVSLLGVRSAFLSLAFPQPVAEGQQLALGTSYLSGLPGQRRVTHQVTLSTTSAACGAGNVQSPLLAEGSVPPEAEPEGEGCSVVRPGSGGGGAWGLWLLLLAPLVRRRR